MSGGPRPFQQATIRAALRVFRDKSSPRRFLVADEPGLGKTVVARGVLQELSQDLGRPLCVFYVCSNQSIARQNLRELVKFLPESEQESALATVDRPSLLPVGRPPTSERINVYSLTPGTALPGRGGRSSRGRVEERALIHVLLTALLDSRPNGLRGLLRSGVRIETFSGWVDAYRSQVKNRELRIDAFMPLWRRELEHLFSNAPGASLADRITDTIAKEGKDTPGLLIAKLRASVACAALSSVRPDIVIFDEFQRFRDLLDEPSETEESAADAISSRVLKAVVGDHPSYAPGLLLLSATPYTPYRSREGIGSEANLTDDFFELIKFLAGGNTAGRDAAQEARKQFQVLEEELLKGTPLSEAASAARHALQTRLSRLMSRTERSHASIGNDEMVASMSTLDAPLLAEDFAAFRYLADSLNPDFDRPWAVPFWQSVPLPMQALGNRYKSWRRATFKAANTGLGLKKTDRDQYESLAPWPHPRLRAMFRALPLAQLSLPWVRPSMPWWPLAGPWANGRNEAEADGKALIFSQFLAVPSALAGLLSYAVEAKWARHRRVGKAEPYQAATDQSRLDAHADRPGLLELFHPSPLLAGLDPLANGSRSYLVCKAQVQAQLRSRLATLGITVTTNATRSRQALRPWQLLPILERKAGDWDVNYAAWTEIAAQTARPSSDERDTPPPGGALKTVLDKWNKAAAGNIEEIDDDQEFNQLVDLAMESPAVVLGRAIARHWPEALEGAENRTLVMGLAWRGLRNYFDTPWFVGMLEGGKGKGYPTALRQAVIDGNLESVLDEHLWYLSTKAASWPERLKDLETALRIRASRVLLHELGDSDQVFSLRCHAAVALTEARTRAQLPDALISEDMGVADRPEDVRKAFNSPFWPHVLVTTSVGQEGLDFHPWCRTLLHWDLCGGPIDLEQREGRINRYAGLAIRRAIAARLAPEMQMPAGLTSPWRKLAQVADEQLSDATGLSPWWVAPGAQTKRFYFNTPGSELQFRAASLSWERAHYRLVLGMPDQADLLASVATSGALDEKVLREACLDLAAINVESR